MLRKFFAILVPILLSVGIANAQVSDARLSGTVTDAAGAAIAGAKVIAENLKTGNVSNASTDHEGFYRFPIAALGEYRLIVESVGFKKLVRNGIQLQSPQALIVDFSLEPGDAAESVTIDADAVITNESRFDVGHNINSRDVRSLPLVSRNPFNFILLQPGTSGRMVSGPQVVQLNSAGLLRRVGDNLDGAYINDSDRAGFRLVFVSEVYVSDVQLLSRGYSAEFGNTAGDVINITSRSGSNRVIGEAALLLRPSNLSSRSFGTILTLPQKDINGYGLTASIGGPMLRDRVHYYLGYEHTVRKLLPTIAVAPASRNALVAAGLPSSIFENSLSVIDHFPYFIVRTDAQLSESSRLSFRYNRFDVSTKNAGVGGPNTTELSTMVGGGDFAMGSQLVTTFSGDLFNEARFAYAKRNTFLLGDDRSGSGPSVVIRGNGVVAAFGPNTGIGTVDTNQSTTQFIDSVTKSLERHELRFGTAVNFIRDATADPLFSLYEFSSVDAYSSAMAGIDRRSYATYTETFGEPTRPMKATFLSAFVQDQWRATRRLRLDIGLRYELFRPPNAIRDSPFEASRQFRVDRNNFALRFGASYLLRDSKNKTVIRAGAGVHYDPLQLRFYRRALLNNGDPRFFTVRFGPGELGAPQFPNSVGTAPPGVATLTPAIDAVSPDFETMYAVHSHMQIEHALSENMSVTAGYLSTTARHIPVIGNVNCLATGEHLADGRPVYGTVIVAANGNVTVDRPCIQKKLPQFGQVLMAESSGSLSYNGVFVQWNKRFSKGLQAMAVYTFSKGMDDAPESVPGGQFQTDPSDRRRDRGVSAGDVRHLFRASFVAEPRINLRNRFASRLLNGFRISAIALADSGEAFNITTNFDLNRDGVTGDRPAGIPRNFGRLPAFFGLDVRASREAMLTERVRLEAYVEAANAFNKKSVSGYDPSTIPARNVFTSAVDPLTGVLRVPLPESTPATAVWRTARQIQLGIKVHF